jgi:hypothetical protein
VLIAGCQGDLLGAGAGASLAHHSARALITSIS